MQRPAQDAAYYIGYTCILYFYLMRAIDIEALRGLIVIDVAISYIYSVTWTHVRDPASPIPHIYCAILAFAVSFCFDICESIDDFKLYR